MRFRLNPILIAEVLVVAVVAVGLGLAVSHRFPRHTPTPTPISTKREQVQIMPASSGELWRKTVFASDGSVTQTWIAYQDGRLGGYFYDAQGHPQRYVSYHKDGDSQPYFEARFADGGRSIVWSSSVDETGNVTVRERLSDGTRLISTARADGTQVSQTVTLADGSSKELVFAEDGKTVRSSTVFNSEAREVQVNPRLKVTMHGARVREWTYLDESGKVLHKGEFAPDGVWFTFVDSDGRATHRQHWRQMGEDWQQKYYQLDRIDEFYSSSGKIYRQIFFAADGKTVRESRLFRWDGTVMEVRYYDEKGLALRTDVFDYDGKFQFTRVQPSWYTGSEWVYDSLLEEPGKTDNTNGSGSGSIYRLKGRAFAQEPSGAGSIDPIFAAQPTK